MQGKAGGTRPEAWSQYQRIHSTASEALNNVEKCEGGAEYPGENGSRETEWICKCLSVFCLGCHIVSKILYLFSERPRQDAMMKSGDGAANWQDFLGSPSPATAEVDLIECHVEQGYCSRSNDWGMPFMAASNCAYSII